MTEEDYKYRQGRRKKQVEGHAMMAMVGLMGIVLMLLVISFITSC